jgi:hypothetical protein
MMALKSRKRSVAVGVVAILAGIVFTAPAARAVDVGAGAGDATYFTPGLGACGLYNSSSDPIVALSAPDFDPSTPDGNPNNNPLCDKKILITQNGRSTSARIVDRCASCKAGDILETQAVEDALGNSGDETEPEEYLILDL